LLSRLIDRGGGAVRVTNISGRIQQFFARRDEALDLVESLVRFLRLNIVESEGNKLKVIEPSDLRDRPADRPLRIYLAETKPTEDSLKAHPLQPGRWGWVQVDLPIELPDMLLLGTIGAKSDWHDPDAGLTRRSEKAPDLWARVSRVVGKALKGPMWVRNVRTGAARPYRKLQYSEGAKQWLERGWKFRQEGVANTEFLVSDPSLMKPIKSSDK
jgi:hypothetical protein